MRIPLANCQRQAARPFDVGRVRPQQHGSADRRRRVPGRATRNSVSNASRGCPADRPRRRWSHARGSAGGPVTSASFGDDEFGLLSRESLIREGVDVSAARTVAGATNQFAVILVDARTGERTVLWDRHPALAMPAGSLSESAVTSGRVLIVDCQETAAATQAARYARDAGILTVIDVEKVRPGIGDLLQQHRRDHRRRGFPTALTGI